jgi:hypothetical protein
MNSNLEMGAGVRIGGRKGLIMTGFGLMVEITGWV